MTAAEQCPNPADLEDFLHGRAAPDLERHLAACESCASRAAGLRSDDAVIDAVRRAAAGDTPVPELTEELATVFRRLLPTTAGMTVASDGRPWSRAPRVKSGASARTRCSRYSAPAAWASSTAGSTRRSSAPSPSR